MEQELKQRMWWEAYLVAAQEFRRGSPYAMGASSLADSAAEDAEAALEAFERRWGQREVGDVEA